MAMNPKCIAQVRAAAGSKPVSDAKLRQIEDRLSQSMRELARRDPQRWQGLSRDERMTEAATFAMQELQREAALKEYRATLQVIRTAETNERISQAQTLGGVTRSKALIRDIELSNLYVDAIRDENISQLTKLIDAATDTEGTSLGRNLMMRVFDVDNPAMTADVVREVFKNADGSTGNKAAQQAAKAWLDTIEGMRQRFNKGGGDIGKLGYGYLSQAHDAARVLDAGADVWAGKVLPLLDRNQYRNADGSLMSDADMTAMLKGAWETIASQGDNKTTPGQFRGTGARANRGADHRVLHFKDGDTWMEYMGEYGQGSLYDAMLGHVSGMARDIGLVERYGPNPEQQFRVQDDVAKRVDGGHRLKNIATRSVVLNEPLAYWDLLTGKAAMAENAAIGRLGQDVRNIQTAAKLGGAILSSTTDLATIATTLHFNRLPYFDMLRQVGKQFDAEQREFLRSHGVIAESLASTLNRWTGDHMTHGWSGRVASSVMKLSFMNAWTDGLRSAFAATMMSNFSKKLGKAWGDLDEWDQFLMKNKGITEADWAIISQAKPVERAGVQYLTFDAVRDTGAEGAQQAANKWLAFVNDEAQFAVINPDMATRAIVTGGGSKAGTFKGEGLRTAAQFKSFPLAMVTRHWRRALFTPQGMEGAPAGFGAETAAGGAMNRVAVLAGLSVSAMLLGGLVLQNKALLQGKDPFDMSEGKFWGRAFLQGGGAGFVGDLLFKDPTEFRSTTLEQQYGAVLGPAAGAAAGLFGDLMLVNAWEAAKDKETKFVAEALRWTNANLPGASLWQIRPFWEHWVLHSAQEAANPGYLGRMQQRAMRDWGQDYWWAPGEAMPDRLPEFGRAFGED